MAGIFEPLYGKQSAWSRTTQNTYSTEPKYEPKLEAKLKEEQKIKSEATVNKDVRSSASNGVAPTELPPQSDGINGFGFWVESNKMKLLLLVAVALAVAFVVLYLQQQKQRKMLAGMRKKMKMLRG